MKNILIIIPQLYSGGAEQVARNLKKMLSKSHNVYMLVFDCKKDDDYILNNNVINLNTPANQRFGKRIFYFLKKWKVIKQIKKEKQIDVSVSLLLGPNLLNVLTRSKTTITSIRTLQSKVDKTFYKKLLTRFIIKNSNYVVALSKFVEYDLKNNYFDNDKIVTIYNQCDYISIMEHSLEKCSDFIFEKDKFYYCTAGRLTFEKGQWHLIKAFSLISKKHPECELIILGEGKLKHDLKYLCNEFGIQDKVHFLGFKKNPHTYIKKSDCFVFTSLYEGLGQILIEVLSCECPIISVDCDAGPKEILAPKDNIYTSVKDIYYAEYGILVPSFNIEKDIYELKILENEKILARAMLAVLENTDIAKRYRNCTKHRALYFSEENILSEWNNLIS